MTKTAQQPQKNTSPKSITSQPEQEQVMRKAQTPAVNPQHILPAQVPYLQRTIGNRAVSQLLQRQTAGQIQRAPADIQRHYPHGATHGPQPQGNQEGLKEAIEQMQAQGGTLQRSLGEELEDEEEGQ